MYCAFPCNAQAYVFDKVQADDAHVRDGLDIIRAFPEVSPSTTASSADSAASGADAAGVQPAVAATLDELARYVSAFVKWALK